MSLVVEDGTGQSTAESYVSASTYRTFWVNRNDADIDNSTTPTDAELEADLREGFAFVNNRARYNGVKVSSTQAGAFPRNYLYDREGNAAASIPASVKEAQMRAARAHRAGELFPRSAAPGAVASIKVDGVVEKSFFAGGQVGTTNPLFDLIDALLEEWTTAGSGSVPLVRG